LLDKGKYGMVLEAQGEGEFDDLCASEAIAKERARSERRE
jgi:hypothetical protein